MARVGFIGLGVMGFPMAGHLVENGHEMIVYNRSIGKMSKFAEKYSCRMADSPAELARDSEFIFCCVGYYIYIYILFRVLGVKLIFYL